MFVLADCSKGGIGRNLKNIVSSLRWAQHYSQQVIIYWPNQLKSMTKTQSGKVHFTMINNIPCEQIFDLKKMKLVKKVLTQAKHLRKYSYSKIFCTWQIELLPNELVLLPKNFSSLQLLIQNHSQSITYEFDRIPQVIKNKLINDFQELQFQPELVRLAQLFMERNKFGTRFASVIGVTIRTWPEHPERAQWYHLSHYIDQIDRVIEALESEYFRIFICADDKQAIDQLKTYYPDKVIEYSHQNEPRIRGGTYNLNINDLIDLLILSQCPIIIGNRTSNWTELVWYLSGCQSKVIPINEIYNQRCLEWIKLGRLSEYQWTLDINN